MIPSKILFYVGLIFVLRGSSFLDCVPWELALPKSMKLVVESICKKLCSMCILSIQRLSFSFFPKSILIVLSNAKMNGHFYDFVKQRSSVEVLFQNDPKSYYNSSMLDFFIQVIRFPRIFIVMFGVTILIAIIYVISHWV